MLYGIKTSLIQAQESPKPKDTTKDERVVQGNQIAEGPKANN